MKGIRVISQVVVDLADSGQNTNDTVLGLGSNYTKYSAIVKLVLEVDNG